jgi:alkylation response protein AidB-like acyl-CoA dehydrogenase
MLSFAPTEEQEEIRRLALSLANEQLRPQGRAAEKRGDIPEDVMRTLAQTGLTMPFPEVYGGSGSIEAVTYALIAEELGFGDGALAMNIVGSLMGPVTVALAGLESQQEEYIRLFTDERQGAMRRGSFAFAERTGGYTQADISATARQAGETYVLNGTKRDVLHGADASVRVGLFRLEGTTGNAGLCAFVLPAQAAGLTVSADVQKLGMIAAPSVSYVFENVVVPTSALLGEVGCAGVLRAATLYNILRAGVACGIARAALEYAKDYAKGRYAFGRPIASYQGIAFIVAEMAMKLDAARLQLWHAATLWDSGAADAELVHEAEAAQYQAIKIGKSATIDAVQVLGGAGFLQDHPVEMWMRDAAAME